jgi:hypothetical protein
MNSKVGQLTSPFRPRNALRSPPKLLSAKLGQVGDVTVSYCDVIPRLPPGDARGETSLSPLSFKYRQSAPQKGVKERQ